MLVGMMMMLRVGGHHESVNARLTGSYCTVPPWHADGMMMLRVGGHHESVIARLTDRILLGTVPAASMETVLFSII
jgi:hypothetical protein